MTNQVNIANFQQKFIINVDAKTAKQVPVEQRKILTQAYMKLFSGFAWVNWTQKHSLGRAWQTALNQCASMVATKNKKNPAARYLNNVCEAHRKYWSRIIMLNPNSENTINKKEDYVKKMHLHGQMMIKQAMDTINVILARYNEFMETIEAQQQPKQKAQEQQNANKQKEQEQAKQKQAQKPEQQKKPAQSRPDKQEPQRQAAQQQQAKRPEQKQPAQAMQKQQAAQQKPQEVVKKPVQQNARTGQPMMQRPQSPLNRALPQRADMMRPAPDRAMEKPVVQKQQNTNHREKFVKGQQRVKILQVKLRVIRIAKFKQAGIMRGFGQQRA